MCGPHRRFAPLLSRTLRRIPQAVSTVATLVVAQLGQDLGRYVSIPQAVSTVATWLCVYDIAEAYAVSIPQAVSTVATETIMRFMFFGEICFNTASGKHCCNRHQRRR